MYKAVVSNHKEKNVPATCAKNTQRRPIDSLWTSPGLMDLRCGFLPFHDIYGFQSNHRLVWADICNEDLLGYQPQHIYRTPRAKARSNDPEVREKCIQHCIKEYGKEDVINDSQTLTYFCQQQQQSHFQQSQQQQQQQQQTREQQQQRPTIISSLKSFPSRCC